MFALIFVGEKMVMPRKYLRSSPRVRRHISDQNKFVEDLLRSRQLTDKLIVRIARQCGISVNSAQLGEKRASLNLPAVVSSRGASKNSIQAAWRALRVSAGVKQARALLLSQGFTVSTGKKNVGQGFTVSEKMLSQMAKGDFAARTKKQADMPRAKKTEGEKSLSGALNRFKKMGREDKLDMVEDAYLTLSALKDPGLKKKWHGVLLLFAKELPKEVLEERGIKL